ncbi:MAG: DNA repair protein RecN [Eubacteriales bacterium]|nr:DNA repair protein RecN [Eubacteriales bacterium]
MLVSLHVKNLALIQETEVLFGEGLNILTGETGAGKSVILGSVALALGGKAEKDMIRTGADYALIELTFEVTEPVRCALEAMEIPMEDNQVILQRRVMPSRSICRVNGETVNVRALRELAGLLIDIHGQHDSQILLQTKRHLEILDGYAGGELPTVRASYQECWRRCGELERQLRENGLDEAARKRELSLAQFELDEIAEAALTAGEDEQLERDYRRMVNGRRIAEALGAVHGLTGYESGDGAGEAIGRALRELGSVVSCDEGLEEFYRQLSEVDGLLNDFNRAVSDYLSDLEFDGETFKNTEERLNYINRLKDKYGRTIADVLAYAEHRQEELERLLHQDEWLEKKRGELAAARKQLEKKAGELSALRRKAAADFCRDMQAALQDMNFLHVEFAVSLTPKGSFGSDGADDAVFMISTNPGEPVKPLASIASGGELSRIMLALKTITARQETIGTFIFDEIDAGISGRTAWKVAHKLGILAKTHQIICITHLPQIAAMADHHFYIEKNAVGDSTATTINELNGEESLQELARLSGAAQLTPGALENARQMKELAEKNK